jgi:hypothetical protein
LSCTQNALERHFNQKGLAPNGERLDYPVDIRLEPLHVLFMQRLLLKQFSHAARLNRGQSFQVSLAHESTTVV